MIVTLETERLRLRAHRADDLDACAAMWADPVVVEYIGGRASTREETWGRLLRYAGMWSLVGYGYWAVEERLSGAFVGEVGFADFKRDLTPPLPGPELGWVLATNAHGRGFATEATRAAVAWGDAHLGARATACIMSPENIASMRVAEKCGYRFARHATYKGAPILGYERTLP